MIVSLHAYINNSLKLGIPAPFNMVHDQHLPPITFNARATDEILFLWKLQKGYASGSSA